jgi:GTP-binding protein
VKIPARFITSAADPAQFPPPSLRELAVVGRSNVGKSSLINALVGHDGLARTSRTPGRTRLLNWFEVTASPGAFFLVDLPGYGYAEVSADTREAWRPLIEKYLGEREPLGGVLLLVDIRRGVAEEELDFMPWLAQRELPVAVALTKADKLPKNKRNLEVGKARRALGLTRDPVAVSTLSGDGIDALWRMALGMVFPR